MKKCTLAALGAILFCVPAFADTATFNAVYQDVEYKFDGVSGSLSITLKDQNDAVGAMINFKCDKAHNSVTIVQTLKEPPVQRVDFKEGWVAINGKPTSSRYQSIDDFMISVFSSEKDIIDLLKDISSNLGNVVKIDIYDNEKAFVSKEDGRFEENGLPPFGEIELSNTYKVGDNASTDAAKKEFEQFSQFCSNWWGKQ